MLLRCSRPLPRATEELYKFFVDDQTTQEIKGAQPN